MIAIGSIGYNHTHSGEFVFDCPNGPGANLFLLVKSHCYIEIRGVRTNIKPGTAIFLSPKTPYRYSSVSGEYIDDWFYYNITDEDAAELKRNGIIFDEPTYIGTVNEISSIIYAITIEFYSAELFHEELVHLYTEILFRKLSRVYLKKMANDPSPSVEKKTVLANLRSRIYREPGELPSIAELADELGISVSGLEHLYKKTFGTSVMNDIVSARIDSAKRLLLSSDMRISDIAEKCGYNCCYSFMRQFKQRTGQTATEYRKNQAAGAGA